MLPAFLPYFRIPPLRIGPLSIEPFGVLAALGVYLASVLLVRRARDEGLDPSPLTSFATWALLGGIAGGRLAGVLRRPRSPRHPDRFSPGGLASRRAAPRPGPLRCAAARGHHRGPVRFAPPRRAARIPPRRARAPLRRRPVRPGFPARARPAVRRRAVPGPHACAILLRGPGGVRRRRAPAQASRP